MLGLMLQAMIWGGGYIATAGALKSFDSLSFLAARFTLASLLMLLFFWKDIRQVTWKEWRLGLPVGLMLFLSFTLQTYGLKFTSVSHNAFLTATNVIFTPYLVWVIYQERPSKRVFVASLLSLVAVGFLTMDSVDLSFNLGDWLTLASAVFFSLHIIVSLRMREVNLLVSTFIQFVVAAILSLVACTLVGVQIHSVGLAAIGSLSYLVVLSTIVCYLLQMYGTKYVAPSIVGIILSLQTLFASLLGVLLLGEVLTVKLAISLVLLLVATSLASRD